MYVQGAKISKEQMINNLTPSMRQEVNEEIKRLFMQFDKDNDGTLTQLEISRTMKTMGYEISLNQAAQMIAVVDHQKTGTINLAQFTSLMEKPMLDHIFSAEVMVEDLRDVFREADSDYSGYLSIGELYTCIIK
jgi:calcium-binding protein CML